MPYFTVRGPMVLPSGDSTAFTNFIARTTGLDATHTNAYRVLLNGMTTDGLFNSDGTTNIFDLLYIFATQDQTTAQLSLVNNTFSATPSGGSFTADLGFLGGSTVDTGFNPITATSPKFVQNDAHISGWANVASDYVNLSLLGNATLDGGNSIFPDFSGQVFIRVNDNPETGGQTIAGGGPLAGHFTGTRTSSTARQGYYNGSNTGFAYGSEPSGATTSSNLVLLGRGTSGTSMGSIGKSLNDTQAANFYSRLRTYMTTVGVP